MAYSETGHSKNVAHFETLVSGVQSFGAAYNPARANLKLPALTPMPAAARTAIEAVSEQKAALAAASNARQALFEDLSPLVSRVVNALELTDARAAIGDEARALARKLSGVRAGTRIADDPSTPDADESEQNHSVSQMSFDSRLANYESLVTLLESQASYAPNEPELSTDALRDLAADMRARNDAARSAQTVLAAARAARNALLYDAPSGLVPIASDVKKYIKSAFGTASPQYAQVRDLKFTTIRT